MYLWTVRDQLTPHRAGQRVGHRQETKPGTVGGAQHFSPIVSPAAVANLFRDQGTNSGEGEASQFLSNHLGDTVHGSHLTAHRERQPGSFIT